MKLVPLVLALTVSTAAAAKAGKWVALVYAEGDVPAAWPDALRKAAEGAKGDRVWTEPPAVTLAEAQSALGCANWGPACAGQVAQMTGATAALLIDLKHSDAGIALSSEAVQAGTGQPAKGKNEVLLPDASEDSLKFALAWVKGSLADKLPALLIVDTAVPGGEVRLDGKRAGTTDQGPVRIIVESPSRHTLLVTKAGSAPVTREVTLSPNQTVREVVALSAEGPPVDVKPRVGDGVVAPKPPPAVEPPGVVDTSGAVVGWSLTGVGGVVAAAAGVVAATVANDLYFVRVPCGANNLGWCIPQPVKSPIGLYSYSAGRREVFFEADGPLMLTLASVGVGVGALLAGTGVWFALNGVSEPAPDGPAP